MSGYIKYAVLIFLLILFILLNNYTSLHITDLEKKDVNIEKLSLPFVDYPKGPAGYVIEGKIHSGKISQKTIIIIPDNGVEYITVNGRRVSFDNIDIRSLSDHEKGFALDLEPYIHQGENNFEIKILRSFSSSAKRKTTGCGIWLYRSNSARIRPNSASPKLTSPPPNTNRLMLSI